MRLSEKVQTFLRRDLGEKKKKQYKQFFRCYKVFLPKTIC